MEEIMSWKQKNLWPGLWGSFRDPFRCCNYNFQLRDAYDTHVAWHLLYIFCCSKVWLNMSIFWKIGHSGQSSGSSQNAIFFGEEKLAATVSNFNGRSLKFMVDVASLRCGDVAASEQIRLVLQRFVAAIFHVFVCSIFNWVDLSRIFYFLAFFEHFLLFSGLYTFIYHILI